MGRVVEGLKLPSCFRPDEQGAGQSSSSATDRAGRTRTAVSALAAALAEEGSCFAGLNPKHRVPKLKNETRLELARKLALRQHDKSPIVLDGGRIVDPGLNYQSSSVVAALRGEHMFVWTLRSLRDGSNLDLAGRSYRRLAGAFACWKRARWPQCKRKACLVDVKGSLANSARRDWQIPMARRPLTPNVE
ncbi:hypothetical protein BLJAPNOD_06243 [Ensifer sp. M14]|nr:hypothetical protein BLJAPNOD_06243 [Ensifer sp. M14]